VNGREEESTPEKAGFIFDFAFDDFECSTAWLLRFDQSIDFCSDFPAQRSFIK